MKLILRGRRFGFSLEEIRQWLEMYEQRGTRGQYQVFVEYAERQLNALNEQIAGLEAARDELLSIRDEAAKLVEEMPEG